MTGDDTALIVGDVVRAALDDCRVHLGPKTENALIARTAELLQLYGYGITRFDRED